MLRDVGYLIEAHLELTARAGSEDQVRQHRGMFKKRVRSGASTFLGSEDHPASVSLLEDLQPQSIEPIGLTQDLGWMVYDVDHVQRGRLRFFRAVMRDGVVAVPPSGSPAIFG